MESVSIRLPLMRIFMDYATQVGYARIVPRDADGTNGCYELNESIAKLPDSRINASLF